MQATLIRLTYPADHRREACIHPSCHWKQKAVSQAWILWVRDSQLSNEAGNGDGVARYDKIPSSLSSVRPKGKQDDEDNGKDIEGNGEQLGVRCRVTELFDNGRDCRRKARDSVNICRSEDREMTDP